MRHIKKGMIALTILISIIGVAAGARYAASTNMVISGQILPNTNTLAPELRLAGDHGIDMKTLMALSELAQRAIDSRVRPERFEDFARSTELLTPEMSQRIDPSFMTVDGNTLSVGYRGDKGLVVITFTKKNPQTPSDTISPGAIDLENMIVWIENRQGGSSASDVTISSGGQDLRAIHQGETYWEPRKGFIDRFLKRGDWHERPGVNGEIRSLRLKHPEAVMEIGMNEIFDEDLSTSASVRKVPGMLKVIDSIKRNGYKFFVYDTRYHNPYNVEHEKIDSPDYRYFETGSTTHAGIRTGSIHMTRSEYERIKSHGVEFLAARIAHEVTEINLWRLQAEKLIRDGEIKKLGTFQEEYSEAWCSDIRKWIKDNCDSDYEGPAQVLDREFHGKALMVEMAYPLALLLDYDMIKGPLSFNPGDEWVNGRGYVPIPLERDKALRGGAITPEDYYTNIASYAEKMLTRQEDGGRPISRMLNMREEEEATLGKYPYDTLRKCFLYFGGGGGNDGGGEKSVNRFLEILRAKATIMSVKWKGVKLEEELTRNDHRKKIDWTKKNLEEKTREIEGRLSRVRYTLDKVSVIDPTCYSAINDWIPEVREAATRLQVNRMKNIDSTCDEILDLANKRHKAFDEGVKRYRDPDDVVIADTGGEGRTRDERRETRDGSGEMTEIESADVQMEIDGFIRSFAGSLGSDAAWGGVAAPDMGESEPKGVIIYADDVVDSSAVFDAGKLAGLIGDGKLLSKVVLYAKDPRKAEIIEKVIKDNNRGAEVVTVTEDTLKTHYGEKFYQMSSVESVMRYTLNRNGVNAFTKPDEILGVVRGALTIDEDADKIKEELKHSNYKVPVVAFESSAPGSIYSLIQAVTKLVEMRADKTQKFLFYMLPPITKVTEALQKQYDRYLILLRRLETAA